MGEFIARLGLIALNDSQVSGSLRVTNGITGSLFGTASWAQNAVSSSHVLNAVSASFSTSASQAQNSNTASYVLNAVSASFATSASQSQNSNTASYVLNAVSASFATTASFALNAGGGGSAFPFTGSAIITGSLGVTGSMSVRIGTATELNVQSTGVTIGNVVTDVHTITGSLSISGSITGSLFGTSSWSNNAISSSFATTASYALSSAGGGGSAPTAVTFNRITGSYTFVLSDAGKTIEVSGSTAISHSLTIPASSSVDFADGTFIDVILYGTGSILFVTASGVTIRSANNWNRMGTRYGAATLINIAGNEWYLIGNINP